MAQKDRTEAYNQFGKASAAILLCTDVAARGLDFQNVSGIVQYEPPGDAAEYVHRSVNRSMNNNLHSNLELLAYYEACWGFGILG